MDEIDQAISEIATKHGIAVGRDDPIMVLHTMNQRLVRETAKAQEASLDAFKSDLEGIAHRWGDNAKDKAEKVLSAALSASTDTMNKAGEKVVSELRKAIQTDTGNLLNQIDSRLKQSRQIAILNVIAGLCIVGASVITIFIR